MHNFLFIQHLSKAIKKGKIKNYDKTNQPIFSRPPSNHDEEKQLVNNLTIIQSRYPKIKLVSLAEFKINGFKIQDSSQTDGTVIFSDRFLARTNPSAESKSSRAQKKPMLF